MKPIISPNSRIRHPDSFEVGPDSIVDDYCYFSTQVRVGTCSHIASGCSVAGGGARLFTMGDFSSLSSGVKIWCASDDFSNDLVTIIPPGIPSPKKRFIQGDVSVGNYTAIGANSVVMPGVDVPDGTVIGALSFVPAGSKLKAWSVYAGSPVRRVRNRNKRAVLAQVEAMRSALAARGR